MSIYALLQFMASRVFFQRRTPYNHSEMFRDLVAVCAFQQRRIDALQREVDALKEKRNESL